MQANNVPVPPPLALLAREVISGLHAPLAAYSMAYTRFGQGLQPHMWNDPHQFSLPPLRYADVSLQVQGQGPEHT